MRINLMQHKLLMTRRISVLHWTV